MKAIQQIDEDILQRICDEERSQLAACGLDGIANISGSFAKAVARRYAETVWAGVPEDVKAAVLGMTQDAKEPIYGSNVGSGDEALRTWWETAGGEFEREADALGVYAALAFLDKLIATNG